MNLRSYLRGAGLGILVAAVILTFGGGSRTKAMTDAEVLERARELGMSDGNETLTEAYTVATAPEIEKMPEIEENPEIEEIPEKPSEAVGETGSVSNITPSEPAAEKATEKPAAEEAAEKPAAEEAAEKPTAEEAAEKPAEDILEESIKNRQTTELKSDLTGEDKTKSELLADAAETEAESEPSITETETGFVSVHINAGSSSTVVAKELEKAGAVSCASAFDGFLCANGYDRRLSTGDFRIPAGASDEEIARILMRR
ncbi:MAG: hypothetical protein IJU87_04260 [Lachnospiraceae bacterium]|nr:hypothetical protein [Lachnospiraceae bacterium]